MSSGIRLIIGLGNPGEEYENTRHNAGAWFVSALANQAHASFRKESKFHAFCCAATLHGQDCHLAIPTVYMNESGLTVKALSHYYKIEPEAILIAHDEIDLVPGDIRLKFDGGHGGHNGLRDIISHLNTNQFHRLRIGVGRPRVSSDTVDYVLHAPSKVERQQIDDASERGLSIIQYAVEGQIQKAMKILHTPPSEP